MFTAAAFLMASAVSCDKNNETNVPSLILAEKTVTISASGGTASITYTLGNPTEDLSVTAEPAEDWVNTFDYGTEGTITFNVDANTSADERKCDVAVTCKGIGAPETFTVIQQGQSSGNPDGPTFTISFKVDGTAVDMNVIPSDPAVHYYFDVVAIDELESDSPEGIENFCQEQLETIMQGYESWGYSIPEAIADFCSVGEDSFRFPDLKQESAYYGYAFAVDDNACISSGISYSGFETEKVEQSDLVLEINVYDITAYSAMMDIIPSNDDQYTFILTPADDFAGMADEEILMMLLDGFWLQPVTGPVEKENIIDLYPDTSYAVYAFGYQGGMATTSLYTEIFTTPAE